MSKILGYNLLSETQIELINDFKVAENHLIRLIAELMHDDQLDKRWLAIGKTELQKAFMCLTRAISRPGE